MRFEFVEIRIAPNNAKVAIHTREGANHSYLVVKGAAAFCVAEMLGLVLRVAVRLDVVDQSRATIAV